MLSISQLSSSSALRASVRLASCDEPDGGADIERLSVIYSALFQKLPRRDSDGRIGEWHSSETHAISYCNRNCFGPPTSFSSLGQTRSAPARQSERLRRISWPAGFAEQDPDAQSPITAMAPALSDSSSCAQPQSCRSGRDILETLELPTKSDIRICRFTRNKSVASTDLRVEISVLEGSIAKTPAAFLACT